MTRRIATAILLTVWATLLLAASTAYIVTRSLLLEDLDEALVQRAASLPELTDRGGRHYRTEPELREEDRYVVRDAIGRPVARPPADNQEALESRRLTALRPKLIGKSFSRTSDGSRVRTVTLQAYGRPVEGANAGPALVPVIATFRGSARQFDETMALLTWTLIASGAAGGIIAALAARTIARAALRPLDRTAAVIGSIDEAALDRRVDVGQLPPELKPTALRLNEMLARLEDAFARRKRFLADASHELRTPVAAMLTTARREGDLYVLNGQKNWISYATVADHQLVFAKTDPAAKHKGISAFIVEREWPGVTTRETEHKLGVWAGSTGELFFENVEVPAENLVGEEGQGFEIAMYGLDQGRFTVAAGACGVVRACLERSVEYARERETFGQPIGKYQFVQDMIAEMVLGYETSKLLVMQAAWLKNQGVRNTRETSLAKWHATESAFRAAHLAIQVHGAYGYSAEYGIERYFRNARAPIIYEGTTQIHKLMQAEHALGYRRLNGDGDVSPMAAWAPALAQSR
jgi:signal transduction histidine kinase